MNTYPRVGLAIGTGLLACTTGCGAEKAVEPKAEASTSSVPSPTESTSATPSPKNSVPASETVTVTFDSLGGGDPNINVYSGSSNAPADKVDVGSFKDGESSQAVCKIEGRSVSSDPSVGETERTSSDWIRLAGDVGMYATSVYVERPQQLLAQLPDCVEN